MYCFGPFICVLVEIILHGNIFDRCNEKSWKYNGWPFILDKIYTNNNGSLGYENNVDSLIATNITANILCKNNWTINWKSFDKFESTTVANIIFSFKRNLQLNAFQLKFILRKLHMKWTRIPSSKWNYL